MYVCGHVHCLKGFKIGYTLTPSCLFHILSMSLPMSFSTYHPIPMPGPMSLPCPVPLTTHLASLPAEMCLNCTLNLSDIGAIFRWHLWCIFWEAMFYASRRVITLASLKDNIGPLECAHSFCLEFLLHIQKSPSAFSPFVNMAWLFGLPEWEMEENPYIGAKCLFESSYTKGYNWQRK